MTAQPSPAQPSGPGQFETPSDGPRPLADGPPPGPAGDGYAGQGHAPSPPARQAFPHQPHGAPAAHQPWPPHCPPPQQRPQAPQQYSQAPQQYSQAPLPPTQHPQAPPPPAQAPHQAPAPPHQGHRRLPHPHVPQLPHPHLHMPHLPWSVRRRRRVLPPVGLLVLMAALVLPILGLTVLDAGPVAAGLGTFFALLPVLPVVGVFLWIDRWEPEPGRLLVTAFLWGAGVSTVAALVTSLALDIAWMRVAGVEVGNVAGTVVTAPVVEEAAKGLFLVILLAIKRRELDGIVDGIVYAGFVGVGFAFTENILYLGTAFAQGGLHGGVMLFGMRCVLSPFAHPLFTSMTGLAVGAMARSRGRVKWALPIVGYLGAVLLHGLWNLSASLVDGSYFFAVYVVVMVPLFVAMAAVVVWQRRREQRIVATQLPQFVARGWVRPEEVRLLTTLHSRATWRAEVKRRFGPAAAKAVRDYQTAITELAFLHERLSRGAAGSEAEPWLTDLLNGMDAARARLLHSHPAVLTA